MKKLIITFNALMFSVASINAQITLEHVLDSTYIADLFYCTDIGNNEHKYVFLDPSNNSFSLYNMDMSPYLTNIVIPPNGDSIVNGFTVMYISKTLFDCDSSNIEYAYEYYYNTRHTFRVLRTDGTILLEVDSANGPSCQGCYGGSFTVRPIMNTSDGAKLFLQKEDTNQVVQILIYGLCGSLPQGMVNSYPQQNYITVYPNPTGAEINFELDIPNNTGQFDLIVFNTEGKEIKRVNIFSHQRNYSIDVREYSNGIYYYSLASSKNKIYQSGKFILSH